MGRELYTEFDSHPRRAANLLPNALIYAAGRAGYEVASSVALFFLAAIPREAAMPFG
jgi:hypothetical protein